MEKSSWVGEELEINSELEMVAGHYRLKCLEYGYRTRRVPAVVGLPALPVFTRGASSIQSQVSLAVKSTTSL